MEIKINVLAGYIAALKLFAPVKDMREYLVSISIDVGRKESRLVATDGHRLAVVRVECEQPGLFAPVTNIIVPLALFSNVKVNGGFRSNSSIVEITIGEPDTDGLGGRPVDVPDGARPVTVAQRSGASMSGWTNPDPGVAWRQVFPCNVSGKAAVLNPVYVGDIARVSKILGESVPANIAHNGDASALVTWADENIAAIIMPLRCEPQLTAPDWIADPLTDYPDTAPAAA